jgi:hypothetical protein
MSSPEQFEAMNNYKRTHDLSENDITLGAN